MALTKDELKQIGDVVIEVTTPMFEHVIESLGGRIDKVETRLSSVENEFSDFKAEVRSKLNVLESKIDALVESSSDRFENIEDDIRLIYRLTDKLEKGTKQEQQFAEETIVAHLPAIYRAVLIMAKRYDVKL